MLSVKKFFDSEQLNTHISVLPIQSESGKLEDDYAVCRNLMHRASRNYTLASLFLPNELRPHVEALYALVRVGDDRVDVDHEGFESKLKAIENWQESYWKAFESGTSPDPVLRAYLNTAMLFNIPPETMSAYFNAMINDVTVNRYQTFEDLLTYIEGSANTVGRAMCHILGTKTQKVSDAYQYADQLAIAMQLSNFIRDIGEDWQRGRVYLPLEDLMAFNVTIEDIASRRITKQFIELLQFQIERTRMYYDRALAGVGLLQDGQLGILSSLELYAAILDEVEKNNYDIFSRRASAGFWRKIILVGRARLRVGQINKQADH